MAGVEKQVIEALLVNQRDVEEEREQNRHVYWRAHGLLEREDAVWRHLINWCQDDDGPKQVKAIVCRYEGESGMCDLVLTDFYQWPTLGKVKEGVRLEVYPTGQVRIEEGNFYGRDGQEVFAVDKKGNFESPLGLVDPNIANSLLDICEEEQIRQHTGHL